MLAWERSETGPRAAAVSALAMGLPLVVLVASGHPREGVYAALGSFAGLYALDRPFRSRARVLAIVAAGFTVAALAGSLTGRYLAPWGWVLVVALVAGLAKWCGDRAVLGGPGAWMFLFTCAVCSQSAERDPDVVGRLLLVAGGGAVAWCVSVLTVLHDREALGRRAVASALEATAAVLERGDAATEREWHRAHVALTKADAQLREARAREDVVEALILAEEMLTDAVLNAGLPAPAVSPDMLRETARSLRRRSRTGAGQPARGRPRTAPAPLALPDELAALRRAQARHASVLKLLSASRVVLGAGVAAAGALLLNLGHPYWAPLSATAVLQSTHVRMTWNRSVQRGLGTAGGLLVGGLLLDAHPSPLAIAVLVVLMQWAVALLGARNYALGVVFVTPFAVLLSELLQPNDTGTLLLDRLEGVVLGILVGVASALLVVHPRAAVSLRHALERCRVALAWATRDQNEGSVTATEELRDALLGLRLAEDTARGEPWPTGVSPGEVAQVERRAYRVLAGRLRELRATTSRPGRRPTVDG